MVLLPARHSPRSPRNSRDSLSSSFFDDELHLGRPRVDPADTDVANMQRWSHQRRESAPSVRLVDRYLERKALLFEQARQRRAQERRRLRRPTTAKHAAPSTPPIDESFTLKGTESMPLLPTIVAAPAPERAATPPPRPTSASALLSARAQLHESAPVWWTRKGEIKPNADAFDDMHCARVSRYHRILYSGMRKRAG